METRTALALAVALGRLRLDHSETPKPGDLIVEVTGMRRVDPDAIGWLVGEGEAPYHEDDPLDGSVPMRHVWDVLPLSGAKGIGGKDFQRWENARFAKVPDAVFWMVPELAEMRPFVA